MSTYQKFFFRPGAGEQVCAAISPEADQAASICGRVSDSRGRAAEGALVLLFLTAEDKPPELLARFVTDDDGHFLFGPLKAGELYLIKVYKNNVKLRELEIVAEE